MASESVICVRATKFSIVAAFVHLADYFVLAWNVLLVRRTTASVAPQAASDVNPLAW